MPSRRSWDRAARTGDEMPNRKLDDVQRTKLGELLNRVRAELCALSSGDPELLFAYRRKLAKELTYDERSKPQYRKALKQRMRAIQKGICAITEGGKHPLPERYCVLDRFDAPKGYVVGNVQLICEDCDRRIQRGRGYAG